MTQATSTLWALLCNDPTHPAVRGLCDATQAVLDIAECGALSDRATFFPGGARGFAVGNAWPKLGPALRAAAQRLGWRPLTSTGKSPEDAGVLDDPGHVTYNGRTYSIAASFPNTDAGREHANTLMQAVDGLAMLTIRQDRIILAHKADLGRLRREPAPERTATEDSKP